MFCWKNNIGKNGGVKVSHKKIPSVSPQLPAGKSQSQKPILTSRGPFATRPFNLQLSKHRCSQPHVAAPHRHTQPQEQPKLTRQSRCPTRQHADGAGLLTQKPHLAARLLRQSRETRSKGRTLHDSARGRSGLEARSHAWHGMK